jgi:sec-independent protein translocase protein TatA
MPGLGSFGGTELIVALIIILLLFGAKRIPELARGLGSGVREFKRGTRGEVEDEEKREEKKEELASGKDEELNTHSKDASAEADKAEQKRS